MTFGAILLLCAILGGLAGVIAFLFRAMIETKNQRIDELTGERDYWRSLVGIEARLVDPPEHALVATHAQTLAIPETPKPVRAPETHDRFSYYALAIQAGISGLVLILSFYLIIAPTEPTANQVAYQMISFIVGVWLGRGIDFASGKMRDRS
jgi:hypothetical protein